MERNALKTGVVLVLLAASAQGYEWACRYDGPVHGPDRASAMTLSPDGVPCVAGSATASDSSEDWITLKYDPASGEAKSALYHYISCSVEGERSDDLAKALTVSSSGHIFVAGRTCDTFLIEEDPTFQEETLFVDNFTVVRYDSSLAAPMDVWFFQEHDEDQDGCAEAITAVGDTAFAVGFTYNGFDPGFDVLLTKLYPGGAYLKQEYNNVYDEEQCVAIEKDAAGNILLAGSRQDPSRMRYDYLALSYRAKEFGDATWSAIDSGLGGNLDDLATSVATDAACAVYVTGVSQRAYLQDFDFLTVKYDSLGQRQWACRYNSQENGNDSAFGVAVDRAGYIYVTGKSDSAGNSDLLTIKYSSAGAVVWQRRYAGPCGGADGAVALTVGGDDCIYVTGFRTDSATGQDYWTIKYSAEGAVLDTWGYDYGSLDRATGIAVDRDLNIYVTGTSWDPATGTDIVTVKYRQVFEQDFSVRSIISPPTTVDSGVPVEPSAVLRSNDSLNPSDSITVRFTIALGPTVCYRDSLRLVLQPDTEVVVVFDTWDACVAEGSYTAKCTLLVNDANMTNNCVAKAVFVRSPGWHEMASMPLSPSGRPVKRGGWAVAHSGNGLIYAAKGYKTNDFYEYRVPTNNWEPLAGMRYQIHPVWSSKPPRKGAKGTTDNDNLVYATQGNNTLGWWVYFIAGDSWKYLTDVPLGPYRKKVKGGTDLAYVPGEDTDYVYCLKGYKNEFYRYNTVSDNWETLDNAPIGYRYKYDKGSWLVWDGGNYLYAHKAKYHELYRFDLDSLKWNQTNLGGMPYIGMMGRKKKSKDGGSAVYLDGFLWALKGGNTQEWWKYDVAEDTWTERETIPAFGSTMRKKRVKYGADVVFASGAFYTLKGNKTVEFWRYVPLPEGMAWGVSGKRKPALDGGFGEETICEGVEAERPRWNASGTHLTYFKDVDGYNQIFMKEYGSPEPEVQLTDIETDCENPIFSPSNDWISFQMDDTVEGFWQICRVRTSESDWGEEDGKPQKGTVSLSGVPSATGPRFSAEVTPAHQVPAEVPGFDYDIEQLTTVTEADHANPEYSPGGTRLAFQRDLDGYYQICVMSSEGGDVTQLTADEADHEWPVWLDDSTIVYQKWEDEDYVQLYKININTQAETWLTNGDYDHELPCASSDGNHVSYQVMDGDGVYQIGLVSAAGGDEQMLTESDQDLEQPDWSQDDVSIYATRCHGLCNSIVLVDAVEGGFQAVTDSNAIRENPDAWYDEEGTNNNFVVYSREDTSTSGTFGQGRRGRRYKHGTGIFLTRAIRARGGGAMTAGITAVRLFRATPNPAAGPVRIRWQLPRQGQVSLKAYNIAGQCVATMLDAQAKPGVYETLWTGCDNHGRRLGPGVYFYTLKTEDEKLTHKVVLTSRK